MDRNEEESGGDRWSTATHLAGTVLAWAFVVALVWMLFLGMYALTQWTTRSL